MELSPSVECKWKRKSEWMDKWKWKTLDRNGGLKHMFIWMVSLDIFFFLFSLLFSRNFYYFLIDVGSNVKRRMKWGTMTYEKVWIKGVE